MENDKVLFINHSKSHCGIYQYGKRVFDILSKNEKYNVVYKEIDTKEDYFLEYNLENPEYVIYNWYFLTLPWLDNEITSFTKSKQLLIHHEYDIPTHLNIDRYLMANMIEPIIGKTYSIPRPILEYGFNNEINNEIPHIGSFGFAFHSKNFNKICQRVEQEYDEAVINIHLTSAYFGDQSGQLRDSIEDLCYRSIKKNKIKLNITKNFITETEIIDFLRQNDINIFMYDNVESRGISSVIDYAVSSKKPFAVNSSIMFKHVVQDRPEINIDNNSIKDIIANGNEPSLFFKDKWSNEKLRNCIYKVMETI